MLVRTGYTGSLIYGEMSSPRGHNPHRAGHAEDMVKQLVWAINWRDAPTAPVSARRIPDKRITSLFGSMRLKASYAKAVG